MEESTKDSSTVRCRRDTMGQSEMGASTFKYDHDDDYGIPKLVASQSRRSLISRYRSHALTAFCILLIVYWTRSAGPDKTDWSRFAYVQYATDSHSMCNALMVFEALKRLGSKADRVLIYPEDWQSAVSDPDDRNSQLLVQARKAYDVKLKPMQLLGLDGPADAGTMKTPSGFDASITKLRIFELDVYERIIAFDSDVAVQQHLDDLFFLPATPMAMPREYWTDTPWQLSTQLMLLQPSAAETKKLWDTLQTWRLDPYHEPSEHYDNDLLNARFGASAMVLPHRPYLLQTNEFRTHDHSTYMGSSNGPASAPKWDPFRAVKEAKLIHFDDWPLPKPWVMWPVEGLAEVQPDCGGLHTGTCGEREVWKALYEEFRVRRRDLCKILSVPAPNWGEWKNLTGAG